MTILLLVTLLANDTTWQWPVDTRHGLTASFGEYRGSRFHMGVDFSSAGVEGEDVRPAREGTIFRIRATVNGFGRVIYIRHPDGYTTVYAHLARFGAKLEQAIKQAGKDPLTWFGTIEPGLKVTTDDLIAWTGESGAGPAHFHFELRDSANRPLNPLDFDFPKLTGLDKPVSYNGLYLVPLDTKSRVNGSSKPFFATWKLKSIQAKGRIGVLINAHARGGRNSRVGPRAIRLSQDGESIGEWNPKKLDFAFNGNSGLVLDQLLSGFGPTQYFYCFDDRSEVLDKINGFQMDRIVEIENKSTLSIELVNLMGTTRTVIVTLDPNQKAHPVTVRRKSPVQTTSIGIRLDPSHFHISADLKGELDIPGDSLSLNPKARHQFQLPLGSTAQELIWRTDQGNLKRQIGRFPSIRPFTYPLGNWKFEAKQGLNLDQTLVLQPPDKRNQSEVLEFISPVVHFGREGIPSRNLFVEYDLKNVTNPNQLGLYAWSYNSKYWRYWGKIEQDKQIKLTYLAPLVIARDLVPPSIRKPRFHDYFIGRHTVIPLRDQGSGIDSKSIIVKKDQKTLDVWYDSDRRWIVLPKNIRSGPFTVTISDRAGHQVKRSGLR